MTLFRTKDGVGFDSIDETNSVVDTMNTRRKTVRFAGVLVSRANIGVKKIQATYNVWKPLTQNFYAFVKAVDETSEVHSSARMVWSVLLLPSMAILAQSQGIKRFKVF